MTKKQLKKWNILWTRRLGAVWGLMMITILFCSWWLKVRPTEPLLRTYAYGMEWTEPVDNPDKLAYIKTIFGKEWRTAYAIARAESGLRNDVRHVDENEWSVCMFQINLRAHKSKVIGGNIEQKELWLVKDFKNCVLMAKIIRDGSGFSAWSVYTNGSYRRFL